ncbi:MAG: hypothetical protein QY309_05690 [Cyclobacteriaceae bacterium]|nr:MAG: hypothetical protein QY309_05690 [Cyclobacteriaceae bacterium]
MSGDDGNITLTVPVDALQTGVNNLVIRTGYTGCSNELLSATSLEFTYTPAPQVSVDKPFYSLCENAQVVLKVETTTGNSFTLVSGRTVDRKPNESHLEFGADW